MKLAVVDDEKKATDLIESYVKRFENENEIEILMNIFHNPNDFLEQYTSDYDLVMMDVEMPGLNGIETAKELRRMDDRVLLMFITNMAQYAVNGYEVEAIDYVIKPLSYADFAMKMQKAFRYVLRNKDNKIVLHTSDGFTNLSISDIYYVEVIRHYLVYHTAVGDYTVRGVMKETEEKLLPYHFIRCNHGYLVNMKYVEGLNGNMLRVAGDEITISRNKKSEFLDEFAKYVGGMR